MTSSRPTIVSVRRDLGGTTYHEGKCQENKSEALELLKEETTQVTDAPQCAHDNTLGISHVGFINWFYVHGAVDLAELFNGQCRLEGTVKLSNLVHNVNGVLVTAFAHEELRRLVKSEDKIPSKKDSEGHGADDENLVSPAHITLLGAACLTGANGTAGRQSYVAPVLGSGPVGNHGSRHNADRLPNA